MAPRPILLRSSWQAINIGDIGHTPGLLRLLETYLPEPPVILWPASVDNGVEAMLRKAFPRLRLVSGALDAQGRPEGKALQEAFAEAGFFLHGSGPSVVARKQMQAWREVTGKPYGVYGVTIGEVDAGLRDLLTGAAFVFCRDTVSLDLIRRKGEVRSPEMAFAPDATFAIHLRDEERGLAFLKEKGLEARKFICAIPRLRYTPYHRLKKTDWTPERIRMVETVNAETKERDHAKMREVLIAWVRQTGMKVLACPEMTYQVELAKEILVDPLPSDVKRNVVWMDRYWGPDEAGSVYARAHTVVSFEMHSPIISAAMGTPAFYLRQPTDTSKGQMWRDIGLKDWIFEIDAASGEEISRALLQVHADYPAAQARMGAAMDFVHRRQKETMAMVGKAATAAAATGV